MEDSPFRPFTGRGKWLDRPDSNDGLTIEEKRDRLRSYLRGYDKTLPPEILDVLVHCHNAGEVQFIYPIITTSGWRKTGPRTLFNGRYAIHVQAPLGTTYVDFLIEDTLRLRRVGIELRGPQHFLPGKALQERLRREEMRRYVDDLRVFSRDSAKSAGQTFRVNLMKEQVTQLHRFGIPAERPQNLRFWHSDLAYDVSDVEIDKRAELMKDWLHARNIYIPEEAFPALVGCHHAGEVLFASRIVSLPQVNWSGDSCTIGGLYLLKIHPRIGDISVSFGIKPIAPGTTRSKSLIIIDPPFCRHDITARTQDDRLREMGYQLYHEAAEDAKQLGFKWHQFIAYDLAQLGIQ